jgi:RNA polymerase sigma-70 factor (ECF subfamily)
VLPSGAMDEPHPDAVLLDRIHRDEPGAFEAFVERYGEPVYRFGRRMCIDAENAGDVLQETLIAAYRSLKNLEHPEALRSWVYRVAGNACLMMQRRTRKADTLEVSLEDLLHSGEEDGTAEIPDMSSFPDEEASRAELTEKIRGAVGDLPAHYRIVLVMRDMDGLTTRETADALRLEESAVKMRLHRARLMVRKALERALAGAPTEADGR